VIDGGAIGKGLTLDDLVTRMDDWAMVDARRLVGALVLGKIVALGTVGLGIDGHVAGIDLLDDAGMCGADDLAGVEAARLSMPVPT